MNIHFIQHEIFEAPGAYLQWATDRHHHVTFSKVYEQQPLPASVDHIDLLIVMGGPQSPSTTIAACPHFDAAAEILLIRQCIDAGKAVIGVCLGAQLTGEALGAAYAHSPEKEIGNFPIHLTQDGLQDEKTKHFGTTLMVGHWHNDMPGLTPGSKVLATSEGCPHQIVAYSDKVYGFQCHMELNQEVVSLLIASEATWPAGRFVQSAAAISTYDYTAMNAQLYAFLDKLA